MRKDLDNNGLIYFSNKLKTYLSKKFKTLADSIFALGSKIDSDKLELENKINNSESNLHAEISTVDNKVKDVDKKVINLKTQVDSIDINPIDGDILNINDVEQFVFRNVAAGETVSIPNNNLTNDYMIDCFTEVDTGTVIDYEVITLDENNKDKFIYDSNYIDVAADGVKPKDTILLNFTKQSITQNGISYEVYTSSIIPSDIVDSIESIISISEETI